MIMRTCKPVSEKVFYQKLRMTQREVYNGTADDLTWVENDDKGSEAFCYKGMAYRNFLGTFERGKVVL